MESVRGLAQWKKEERTLCNLSVNKTPLDPLIRKELNLFVLIYSIYKADVFYFNTKFFFIMGKGFLSEAEWTQFGVCREKAAE